MARRNECKLLGTGSAAGTLALNPATGPAIQTSNSIHAGGSTYVVDADGSVKIFGLGSANSDDSLPTNYEYLRIGWNSVTENYEIQAFNGGSGVLRTIS